jgi:hypothetical protein
VVPIIARSAARPGGRVEVARVALLGGEGLLDDALELDEVERLGDVVERAVFERLDRGLDGAVRGDEDEREARLVGLDPAQQAHAVDHRHLEVADHEVEQLVLELRDRRGPVLRGVDLVAHALEVGRQHLPDGRLVVDDQDAPAHGAD